MTDHPILFSAPMVRAILSGSKTQTRRIIKPQPVMRGDNDCVITYERGKHTFSGPPDFLIRDILPTYGLRWRTGDRLWVRETWNVFALSSDGDESWPVASIPTTDPRSDPEMRRAYCIDYRVAGLPGRDGGKGPWRSPIHMPRWAGRITLAVEAVRVERLQDITEGDAIAEGIRQQLTTGWFSVPGLNGAGTTARAGFAMLWGAIHGADAWKANPWVSATTFRRVAT